jgi:hypothetical protein
LIASSKLIARIEPKTICILDGWRGGCIRGVDFDLGAADEIGVEIGCDFAPAVPAELEPPERSGLLVGARLGGGADLGRGVESGFSVIVQHNSTYITTSKLNIH